MRSEFTPEQLAEFQKLVAAEEAGREANAARWRKVAASARETGFSGDLRRAILESRRRLADLAADADMPEALLLDFLGGEEPLPSDTIERLTKLLELHLTALNDRA